MFEIKAIVNGKAVETFQVHDTEGVKLFTDLIAKVYPTAKVSVVGYTR